MFLGKQPIIGDGVFSMKKVLTISVAAYNAENCIQKCLESLTDNAVVEDLDIIVVDDGSTDDTYKVVESYVNRFPASIRLISKKNGGHGSTINASILKAKGKYYKVVDADDWVDKDGIEKLVGYLKHSEVDLVLNPFHEVRIQNCDAVDVKKVYPFSQNVQLDTELNMETDGVISLYMHAMTLKTNILQKMGPIIDENCFYVDMEYTIFPVLDIHSYVCLDYFVYQYLLGTEEQSMSLKNMVKRREQHLKVIERIMAFYLQYSEKLSDRKKQIVVNRIKYAIITQYAIYFSMGTTTSAKSEIKEFDRWLKDSSSELYKGYKGKLMIMVKLNRATGFLLFPFVSWVRTKFR